jgi:signal transduction histidine kinase
MRRMSGDNNGPGDILLVRHLLIATAALTAWFLRAPLHVDNDVLWVLGVAAILNFLSFFRIGLPRSAPIARSLPSLIMAAMWGALVHLTGGAGSPFVAGFGLEILISILALDLRVPAATTVLGVASLWTQQILSDRGGAFPMLLLQTGFLVATGVLTTMLARRWSSHSDILARRHAESEERLRRLERDLDEARKLGAVGENTARLAHRLKGTVHSLRGFTSLIETRVTDRRESLPAIGGLRTAIDQLEELARETLGRPTSGTTRTGRCTWPDVARAIEETKGELSAEYPDIAWVTEAPGRVPSLAVAPSALREVLGILLRNAAEAMNGRGKVLVQTRLHDQALEIQVRDHGCGIPEGQSTDIFKPGWTTKSRGSGFGLHIASRLVESYGGRLSAASEPQGGSCFSLRIPVRPEAPA